MNYLAHHVTFMLLDFQHPSLFKNNTTMPHNAIHKIGKEIFLGFLVIMLLVGATVPSSKRTLKEIALQKQADGKFIAVYMHPSKLVHLGVGDASTNASNLSNICSMDGKAPVKDQIGMNYHATTTFTETLPDIYSRETRSFADQLNEGLGTTAFKAVMPGELPLKTVKVLGQEDQVVDWSRTEYDVMVNLIASPVYTTHPSPISYNTEFELGTMLYVNEVVPGSDALGYIGSGYTLATLRTDKVSHDACLKSLPELRSKVADPGIFSSIFFDSNKELLAKLIEKENKKYNKALK